MSIDAHLAEIAKVKREIAAASSPYRKRDLQKHLKKLRKELETYRQLNREERK